VAYPAYLRDKARRLRREANLTMDELSRRLSLPRTTIYYWVADLPINRPRRQSPGQRRGNAAMQRKYRRLREEAYDEGRRSFAELARDPSFRDFVCLYIAEGYKRNRNTVSLGNADPIVVKLATRWIRAFARRPLAYWLQYHADQDLGGLRAFWAAELGVAPAAIRLQRKSNSGGLTGHNWRSTRGVLTVRACDTSLRAKLQAWMECLKREWLDSLEVGA
jgi:hypothetical protein